MGNLRLWAFFIPSIPMVFQAPEPIFWKMARNQNFSFFGWFSKMALDMPQKWSPTFCHFLGAFPKNIYCSINYIQKTFWKIVQDYAKKVDVHFAKVKTLYIKTSFLKKIYLYSQISLINVAFRLLSDTSILKPFKISPAFLWYYLILLSNTHEWHRKWWREINREMWKLK